jgi:hypothetical protein
MPKDWKIIAQGLSLEIPEADLARTVAPLNALETAFRPLAASLTPDIDISVIYTKSLEDSAE